MLALHRDLHGLHVGAYAVLHRDLHGLHVGAYAVLHRDLHGLHVGAFDALCAPSLTLPDHSRGVGGRGGSGRTSCYALCPYLSPHPTSAFSLPSCDSPCPAFYLLTPLGSPPPSSCYSLSPSTLHPSCTCSTLLVVFHGAAR
ncbi:unnamed protein product, partial [Closterium sp. NIES-54]